MIEMIRLDERLIHGQVALAWTRALGIERIIVADDAAAGNELEKKTLMLAAPSGCRVAIVTVERALALLADPRSASLRILVLVRTLDALLSVARGAPGARLVNVGNFGRLAPCPCPDERRAFGANLYATEEEAQTLREVTRLGIPCEVRAVPAEAPRDLAEVLA